MNELVLYLRGLRDSAGLSVADLRDRLSEAMAEQPEKPPAEATLHRYLRGENLHAKPRLVHNIVDICTGETRANRDAAREHVQKLHDLAQEQLYGGRRSVPSVHPGSAPSDNSDSRAEIGRLSAALQEKERENLRLAAELAAAQQLLSSAAAPHKDPYPTEGLTMKDLLGHLQSLAIDTEQALAEAQAARTETARLRDQLVSGGWGTEPPPVQEPVASGEEDRDFSPTKSDDYASQDDPEIERLVGQLRQRDPSGTLMAAVVEEAANYVLDGDRTGRYQWSQLSGREKALLFTEIVPRLMHRQFVLDDTTGPYDFTLDGINFDLRCSTTRNRWTFPPELEGALVVVIHADDASGRFGYGVVRVTSEHLNAARNRDGKRTLSQAGREAIRWVHEDHAFTTSVLPRLEDTDLNVILGQNTGQARVKELLQRAQGTLVSWNDIATVCRTPDPRRRLREALPQLRDNGILVCAGNLQDRSLKDLGAPVPGPGQWVSMRLFPAAADDPGPAIDLDGTLWRKARPEDPLVALPGAS